MLIVFSLLLTAIATFAAVLVGTGIGYSADRTSQNSVDAAAIAATARLRQVKLGAASPSEVAATAASVAEDNGATSGTVVCEVVNAHYAISRAESDVIGSCDGTNETSAYAAGIRVSAGETRAIPFGSLLGQDDITARSRAASTAQPVREGFSPFMVCGAPTASGHPVRVLLDDPSASPPYRFNTAAIGASYVLWGNEIKNGGRDCGNGSSSWRGLVDFEQNFPIPSPDPGDDAGWWRIETGNKTGQIRDMVVGRDACEVSGGGVEDLAVGCQIAVPLCSNGNGQTGAGFRLHCVSMATFEISYVGGTSSGTAPCHDTQRNHIICGTLLGGAIASGGSTGAATPDAHDLVVINLVE